MAAESKAKSRRGEHFGVKTSSIDERVLTKALEQLDLDTGGTKKKKIERLATYFAEHGEPSRLVQCDPGCGGISETGTFDCCPFCGALDEDEEAEEVDELEKARAVPVADVEGEEVVEVDTTKIPISIDELDRRVQQFLAIKHRAAMHVWRLAQALRALKETGLWMLRQTSDGKQVHKSFGEFSKAELGVSGSYKDKLLKLAGALGEEQVKELDPGQLQVLLKVPKKLMPEVAERARAEPQLTGRQLEQEARQTAERSREQRPEAVTAVAPGEPITGTFSRRPRFAEDDDAPAHSIDEDPWTEIELSNGVVLSIRIAANRAGELGYTIEFRRS